MIPGQFDYVRPAPSRMRFGPPPSAKVRPRSCPAGYSLLPLLKLRLAQPALLVDLRDVGLDEIGENDDWLRIGGRATHRRILEHPVIVERYPLLRDVAGGIGDPQSATGARSVVRRPRGPAPDWPAVLLARAPRSCARVHDGEREIRPASSSSTGSDRDRADESGPRSASRAPERGSGGANQKLERRVGDFSTVGVAVVELDDDGTI